MPRRRNRGLRNTLTLFEASVEQVELQTDRGTALGPVGFESGGRQRVRYDGETFEAVGAVDDG